MIDNYYKDNDTIWGENEICTRTEYLIEKCLELWNRPSIQSTTPTNFILFEDNWTSLSKVKLSYNKECTTFNNITDLSNYILNSVILKSDDIDLSDILDVCKERSIDIIWDENISSLKINGSLNSNFKRDYLIDLLEYINIEPNSLQITKIDD